MASCYAIAPVWHRLVETFKVCALFNPIAFSVIKNKIQLSSAYRKSGHQEMWVSEEKIALNDHRSGCFRFEGRKDGWLRTLELDIRIN